MSVRVLNRFSQHDVGDCAHDNVWYSDKPEMKAEKSPVMNNVVEFKRPDPKKVAKEKAKGKTLCKSGFHKWEVDKKKQFDVKSGKLVTLYRCSRCGEMKVKSH